MVKYRTGHDAPEPRKPKIVKPGELPPGRIPIIDGNTGARRGHVGHTASEATVARFGVRNPKLGKRDGKLAWIGEADAFNRRRQEISRAQRVKENKGSVTFKPTAPETSARPRRGS